MAKFSYTNTRTSLLLSLILHVLLALFSGFVIIGQYVETASEFVAVDLIDAKEPDPPKRLNPTRKIQMRESNLEIQISERKPGRQPDLQKSGTMAIDIGSGARSDISDRTAYVPELATSVNQLKSQFDMTLPRSTGAGVDIKKPGAGARNSTATQGSGAGSIGLSDGAGIFERALYSIARDLVGKNKTGKEDIVFLIDASGTMDENIAAVARYLSKMIDIFTESGLDYTMGVISFNTARNENRELVDNVQIYKQTRDAGWIRRILRSIKCEGNERTFDAIEIGLTQVQFRQQVDKTFILVTDERFDAPRKQTRQSRKDLSLKEMLQEDFQSIVKMCKDSDVKISVLGIEDEMHKALANNTRGLWFQIPKPDDSLM